MTTIHCVAKLVKAGDHFEWEMTDGRETANGRSLDEAAANLHDRLGTWDFTVTVLAGPELGA